MAKRFTEAEQDEGDVLHERFDEEETASFVRLVCSQYNVLFGSFSNHVKNELKTKTWDDICSQINDVFARNRTVISLKCKWQRLVTGVKAKCVDINKANRTTGLHDYEVPQLTATEEEIKNAIEQYSTADSVGTRENSDHERTSKNRKRKTDCRERHQAQFNAAK